MSGNLLTTKAWYSGTDGGGAYIEGYSKNGIRIQYAKGDNYTNYDCLVLSNGDIKWNNNSLIHAGNISSQNVASAKYLAGGPDNRSVNNSPNWYMRNIGSASIYTEFALSGSAYGMYENRTTFIPWVDHSGQRPVQLAFNDSGAYIRTSASDDNWNSWNKLATTSDIPSTISWSNVTSKPGASGNATTPVYWNGSGFTNCTAYGSASVNYANSAGSAGSVAWGNVSGKPINFGYFSKHGTGM